MSTRAEQMANEAVGRMLARLDGAYKAAGDAVRDELVAIVLPVFEAVLSLQDDEAAFCGVTAGGVPGSPNAIQKNAKRGHPDVMRKNAKLQRRNERLMKAIATPASEVPVWGRGPR